MQILRKNTQQNYPSPKIPVSNPNTISPDFQDYKLSDSILKKSTSRIFDIRFSSFVSIEARLNRAKVALLLLPICSLNQLTFRPCLSSSAFIMCPMCIVAKCLILLS